MTSNTPKTSDAASASSVSQKFTLDELSLLAACPKRTVRYYIQLGLLAKPLGETRAAHYLPSHLDALLRIKQLSESGISLERIRDVLSGEPAAVPVRPPMPGSVQVKSHIWIAPGVELQISPEQANASPEEVRALARAVLAVWTDIKKDQE